VPAQLDELLLAFFASIVFSCVVFFPLALKGGSARLLTLARLQLQVHVSVRYES